jgi:ubiquinone/menaquinone biosynthesis C-methylase UbiE
MSILQLSPQVIELGTRDLDFSQVLCLPIEIREMLGDPNKFLAEKVLAFTTGSSQICLILFKNPADDWMLRIVYYDDPNNPKTTGLDNFLSQSLSGQALRDRLDFCSKWIAQKFMRKHKRVVDLGGGSGSYFFEALKHIPAMPDGFHWNVIDKDEISLQEGQVRAEQGGYSQIITFENFNFNDKKALPKEDEKADFAVLIGVLCGMDKDTATKCLRKAKEHIKPGGQILAATLLKKAFDEDPRTFRILCNVGGWQLRPKTMDEVLQCFNDAGWGVREVMSERKNGDGQYAIVHAVAE